LSGSVLTRRLIQKLLLIRLERLA